jgi:hypothetical protein
MSEIQFFDDFGRELQRAADRHLAARPGRRAGTSTWVVIAASVLATVAIAGVAIVTLSGRQSHSESPATGPVPAGARGLVSQLAVLRRPQTSADLNPQFLRLLDRRIGHSQPFGTPVRSLIRLATVTPWGERVFLVPYRPLTRAQLQKLPPGLRRFDMRRAARQGSSDGLAVSAGGCCVTAGEIARGDAYGFGGGAGGGSDFVELVPDGVAKVSLLVARQDYPEGPIFPHPLIATATVHSNVFAVRVSRTVDDLGSRQIWYGSNGAVIKRIGKTSTSALEHVVLPPTPAPETALSRRAELDPSTPNPVSVTPLTGGPHTTFTIRFRSLLNNAYYLYRLYGPGSTGCHGRAQLTYGWNNPGAIAARGQIVTNPYAHPGNVTVLGSSELPAWCPGTFRVTVSASTTPPLGSEFSVKPFGSATFIVRGTSTASAATVTTSRAQLLQTLGVLRTPPTTADRRAIACAKSPPRPPSPAWRACRSSGIPVVFLVFSPTSQHSQQFASWGYPRLDPALLRLVAVPQLGDTVTLAPETWQTSRSSRQRDEGLDVAISYAQGQTDAGPTPISVAMLRTHGLAVSGTNATPNMTSVSGVVVVPDSVATVTLQPLRLIAPPAPVDPRRFGTFTTSVHDNVGTFRFAVPTVTDRRAKSLVYSVTVVARALWRDQQGNIIARTTTHLPLWLRVQGKGPINGTN